MTKLSFDLECPSCHFKVQQRVEDMRPGASRNCPSCGVTINFSGDDGREVQQALDKLHRTMKRMSGVRKLTIKL